MHLFNTPVSDEDAAIASRKSFANPDTAQSRARQQIDTIVLSDDPFIDVPRLFALYNVLYFRSLLIPRVSVSWDPLLTHSPGTCDLTQNEEGKPDQVMIKLSEPLLRFRPRSDVIHALLHESIHAYFFIATRWRHVRPDSTQPDSTTTDDSNNHGHGRGFTLLAHTINTHAGYAIPLTHSLPDDSADTYGTHMWQCTGSCADRAPFYGIVKRAIDMAPSRADAWYLRHKKECGARWKKLAVPEMSRSDVHRRFEKLALRRKAALCGDGASRAGSWDSALGTVAGEGGAWVAGTPVTLASVSSKRGSRHLSVVSAMSDGEMGPVRTNSIPSARKESAGSLKGVVVAVDTSVACCPICHIKVFTQALANHIDRQHSEYAK